MCRFTAADPIGAPVQICPKCRCDDPSMLERSEARSRRPETWFCNNCSHDWQPAVHQPQRFASLDALVSRTGLRRDEVVTLADIGALNSFGYDRRSALWQAERAVRPSGELFVDASSELATEDELARENELATAAAPELAEEDGERRREHTEFTETFSDTSVRGPATVRPTTENFPVSSVVENPIVSPSEDCPLKPMTEAERLVADYAGTGLTMGRHPMALKRETLAMQGVMRAIDLHTARQGRRVRVAGMVITRQRPGTAKGFVFLTLEDETGIANIIVRPDLFARDRLLVVEERFLLIDGVLQNQDGVTSVRAEVIQAMTGPSVDFDAHDFY
jgi:DNA polymerase III alpha subunit